ncbi:YhcH/YjgK/YiaL family protein [Aestuariibaculum suncheonense]|uniref:YhcH/YjgK/YiaL family protein n=1 Tax=Aestuariibaculum suncheonense TaxID=1028745 RepID=A0A8J6Q768_9FLAO|nr:YhcH/YjgK/YiaL family protein [Aestuariibaculum suncheonense]MBD0835256.1 YhcH/YjgK/YiaL family protein [Aestuariibaculum suncheonense]
MILDKIENISLYQGTHKNLDIALKYLKKGGYSGLKAGKYNIQGDEVYAIIKVCKTKTAIQHKNVLEAHKKFIDIHYVIEGTEQIGFATLNKQIPIKAYNLEDDYALYKSSYNVLTMEKGMFAIFFPDDTHLPEIEFNKISDLKKVIVKVKI